MGLTPDEAEKLVGLALDVAEAQRELSDATPAWRDLESALARAGSLKAKDALIVEGQNKLTSLYNKKVAAWETFTEFVKSVIK